MYLSTPHSRVVAIDPVTGKEIRAYQLPASVPSTRGVEYWPGDTQKQPQVVFGPSDGKLYSLNAKTGTPNDAFGDNGIVNLNTPEILHGLPGRDGLSSPPTVYRNLAITGGTTQENPPLGPVGGLVFVGATDDARFRAFDAKTGKELWTFKLGGAAEATPITYRGKDGRQYVVITSTGGGFFNNPVTDDSIMAFAIDEAK
jgi:quinoprotein glucose dehydrogenase